MNRRGFFESGAAVVAVGTPLSLISSGTARGAVVGSTSQRIMNFDSLAAIKTEARLQAGDLCACPRGLYEIVPADTYPVNTRTVIDLTGIRGQAVLHASESLTDMAEALGDTRPSSWFPDGAVVRTRAENFAFEIAEADTSDEQVTNAGGAGLKVFNRPWVEFDAFGGGVGKSGAENTKALSRAMNAVKSKGGRILFGIGTYTFAPGTYPLPDANVWLVGAGTRATQFVPSVYDGETREWMMVFGADDSFGYLCFSGIDVVAPAFRERAKFNGIRIYPTNQLIIRDCYGRFVDGTAWQLERPHNCRIDIRTFKCGSSQDGINSVLISGTPHSAEGLDGAVFNDAVIVGMTEQDPLGWKIENGLVIRPESSIKVHGGEGSTRSLHLHRISNGAMSVYPTLGFDSEAFMVISDQMSVERQTVSVGAASKPTRFNLNVISNQNVRYFGKETGALLAIDCSVPNSRVVVSGDLLKNSAPNGSFRYVRLVAPGNAGAEVDLSDLKFQDEDSRKWIEDNRTESAKLISRRATGVFLAAVPGFVGSSAAKKLMGQTDFITANGGIEGNAAPGMSLIALTDANGPQGTLLYSAMQPITASIETASAARTLVASQRLNIPQHNGKAASALLRRLTIGATGIPETHDPNNYWQVRLYIVDSATDLVLRRDQMSSSSGDGLPSMVLEGWIPESQGFDFHQGFALPTISMNETFSLRLEPFGQPAALEDITASVYFEIRD